MTSTRAWSFIKGFWGSWSEAFFILTQRRKDRHHPVPRTLLVPKLHLGTQLFRQLHCRFTSIGASLNLKLGAWIYGTIAKFNFAEKCVPKCNLGTSERGAHPLRFSKIAFLIRENLRKLRIPFF